MRHTLRRAVCTGALVLAALTPAAVAEAAPSVTAGPVAAQQPTGDNDNRDNGQNDSDGDNGLWGLLGLLGLLGLAGLARKGPKQGAMSGYPVADAGAPPANRYPQAEPRRNPPGA